MQRQDTVIVQLPDSISTEVRVAEPVQTRPVGIGADGIANIVLTLALVLVTAYCARRSHTLGEQVAKEQREHAEDVVRLEREKHELEERRDEEQRRRVRIRVSGFAYAVRRQLKALLEETPSDVQAIVAIRATQEGLADPDEMTEALLTSSIRAAAMEWAKGVGGEPLDPAEMRVQRMLEDARDVEKDTAEAIRRVFVRFYDATGRLNRLGTAYRSGDVAAAYREVQECITLLETVVGAELLDVG